MAELNIRGLQKYYGSTHVLRGIDLHIPEGEFTVFVGPSGCGKSTLLRTIAGLEEVNAGTLEIDGEVINAMRPRDRDIAMVFQNYALYPYMTVYENIAFGLRARKTAQNEITKRVDDAAQLLDIGDYLQRFPRELSGGQRQRVAIGRAIVRDARLYLFDEPLSNLDAQLREDMRVEIKQLHRDIGKTMIYVTHDQVEAMTLADRIVLLNHGEIEQVGAPLELFENPASRFVASFLGSPSIRYVPVILQQTDTTVELNLQDGRQLELPANRQASVARFHNKEILLGVRPEHLRRASSDGDDVVLQVTVDLLQPTGSRSYATFDLGGKAVVAELDAHDVGQVGQSIPLAIDMNRIILVDPESDSVI